MEHGLMTRHGEMMTLMMKIGNLKYRISNFIEDWIYPAYSIRNGLFLRYDTVRMPQLKRTDYHEPCERDENLNWSILDKYLNGNRKNLLDNEFIKKTSIQI